MSCDMPEPCKLPSLVSCQKKAHKEVALAPHPVAYLVFQVGDAEKFPQAPGFENLDPPSPLYFFSRVSEQGPFFTSIEEDGVDKRRVRLELACEADGVASQDPV